MEKTRGVLACCGLACGLFTSVQAAPLSCNEPVRLRGAWPSEPAELVYRGIALGKPWAAPACAAAGAGQPCLDADPTGEDTQGTFLMKVENLPPFGPVEVRRPAVRFDNRGNAIQVRSFYRFEDYDDLKAALFMRYGAPTYVPDQRAIGPKRVEPYFNGRLNDWTIEVHNRAVPGDWHTSRLAVWGGKDYAIVLGRFNWAPIGPRGSPVILPRAEEGSRASTELIVMKLLTREELLASAAANAGDRRLKKLAEWERKPSAPEPGAPHRSDQN